MPIWREFFSNATFWVIFKHCVCKDVEFENERLKSLVEQKDGELSKSEEQTRHLVRLSEKRHQEILSVTFKLNTMERKAREIILNQVKKRKILKS